MLGNIGDHKGQSNRYKRHNVCMWHKQSISKPSPNLFLILILSFKHLDTLWYYLKSLHMGRVKIRMTHLILNSGKIEHDLWHDIQVVVPSQALLWLHARNLWRDSQVKVQIMVQATLLSATMCTTSDALSISQSQVAVLISELPATCSAASGRGT